MRKWHRWLVVVAGIFMVWIAATGLVGQAMTLVGGEHHEGPAVEASAAPGHAAAAPAADHDAKPAKRPRDLQHLIIDLHSGNYFGPFGKVISVLMGAVMLFFSVSGMWMYVDMFRKRKKIGRSGLFWG